MKKQTNVWRRLAAGVLAAGMLLSAMTVPALADDGDETALLTNEAPQSAMVAGSESGGFVYYQVEYPGDDAELKIQATFSVDPGAVGKAVGFHVYGPYDYTGTGAWKDSANCYELTFAQDDPATLTVQVFNYTVHTVSYTIVASGLPETVESDTAADAATVETVAETETETEPNLAAGASGTVVGNAGGAYAIHTIPSDGDGDDVTVTMYFTPDDASYLRAFGFTVYAENGAVVARGSQPTGVLGTYQATFATKDAGTYTVQVYNYADNVPLYYTLSVAQ
jgi:hypothetical protein